MKEDNIRNGYVIVDGDKLYYEVRGEGKPLLIIPAGESGYYENLANMLCNEYKVITYDRRANGRSTMNNPQNFEISQQSRDALSVLQVVGEASAFVFGNSAGAVIALDIAKTYPQAVRALIAHEAPILRLHPEAVKWQRFIASIYLTACRFNSSLASLRFLLGAQFPVLKILSSQKNDTDEKNSKKKNENRVSEKDAADVSMKLELIPVTNYLPDAVALKKNEVKIFMAVGEWSLQKETWYAMATKVLAERLDCDLVTFPGHHFTVPDEWSNIIRNVLRKAEGGIPINKGKL